MYQNSRAWTGPWKFHDIDSKLTSVRFITLSTLTRVRCRGGPDTYSPQMLMSKLNVTFDCMNLQPVLLWLI